MSAAVRIVVLLRAADGGKAADGGAGAQAEGDPEPDVVEDEHAECKAASSLSAIAMTTVALSPCVSGRSPYVT